MSLHVELTEEARAQLHSQRNKSSITFLSHCETPLSEEFGDTVLRAITYLVDLGVNNDGRLATSAPGGAKPGLTGGGVLGFQLKARPNPKTQNPESNISPSTRSSIGRTVAPTSTTMTTTPGP